MVIMFVLKINGEIKGVYSTFQKAWDKGQELTNKCKKTGYRIEQF